VSPNGKPLPTTALTNPYRRPGGSVDLDQVRVALRNEPGILHVETA
jgi:hypothetical protein